MWEIWPLRVSYPGLRRRLRIQAKNRIDLLSAAGAGISTRWHFHPVLSLVEERLFRPKCTGRRLERLHMIYAKALYPRPASPSGLAEDYVESLHRRIVAIRQCFAHYDPTTVARNVP